MENLYLHNSFIFVSSTLRTLGSSNSMNFNQVLENRYSSLHNQDASAQDIYLKTLPCLYRDEEYMGSTSPYDDDGCQ